MAESFVVEHSIGDAGVFHARPMEGGRRATIHSVIEPTLVLGSAQRANDVDHRVAEALGVAVVQRRSGGGAVLLMPDEFVWLDLQIGADDPLWVDDVARSMHWVGELWLDALASLGVPADLHRGGLVSGEWGRQVCFAGVGSGEVVSGRVMAGQVAGDRPKLVGISQRRTRSVARFQSMVHLRFRPELVAALTPSPRPSASMLAARVASVACSPDRMVAALLEALTRLI